MRTYRWLFLVTLTTVATSCAASTGTAVSEERRTPASLIELRLAHPSPGAGRIPVEIDGITLYLDPNAVLSDADITAVVSARAAEDDLGGLLLLDVRLDRAAAERAHQIMAASIGTRMAIIFDSVVVAAPVILEPIIGETSEQMQIRLDDPVEAIALIRERWPEPRQ